MSTVLGERALAHAAHPGWPWIGILAGLALLYAPTYADLARGMWREDAYAHGPIVLAVFAWLAWRRRDALLRETPAAPGAGAACLAFGLALYLLGRTQSIAVFEVASHIPVIAGAVLALRGARGLRALAFPLLFLAFLVPLPGFVLDLATTPLKGLVSWAVELALRLLSYPVERSGVVLAVGDHEMLVADACSGLNSIYSLFALGLLYGYLTGRAGRARMALLLAAIVPIAVVANIVRVLALVLITYHLGEDAARGFVHEAAGLLVFSIALLLLIAWDRALARWIGRGAPAAARAAPAERGASLPRTRLAALAITAAMATVAAAAPALRPLPDPHPPVDLESVVPAHFAGWRIDTSVAPVVPAPDVQANLDRLYRQVVSRTYVNARGERMMLTIAHGGDQSDALKAHRQEACYAAQGFEIHGLHHAALAAGARAIPATRMLAVRGERFEPVTYWFTMGDRVVLGRAERLRVQLEHGLAGRLADGMLVRVSSLSADAPAAFAAQQAFIAAMLAALPAEHATRLAGAPQA